MEYCTTLFGKSLPQLTYTDIQQYFAVEKTETDALEFKSFAGKVDNNYERIIETITGFLNSKGGVLIWGAPQGVKQGGRNEKIFKGALTPINTVLSKDQVISAVSDKITPLPNAIRCSVIENGSGGCVCVFEVDESEYSPHQFSNTYFMRLDGQTRTAPHHYIEALFRKIRYPNLEGFIKVTHMNDASYLNPSDSYSVLIHLYLFNWSVFQNVEDLSYRVISDAGQFRESGNGELQRNSIHKVLHFGEPYYKYEMLYIFKSLISKSNMNVNILLSFGAKNTPAKISEYKFSISDNGIRGHSIQLVSHSGNRLFKELQDEKGMNREETLIKLLGKGNF